MISRYDSMHFQLCQLVNGPRFRLIIDKRDDVRRFPNIDWTKIFSHRTEGHKASQVEGVIVAMPDALQRPNHLKLNSVEQDGAPYRRTPRKQRSLYFISQHDYGPLLHHIHRIQPASFLHRKVSDLVEQRGHSEDRPARLKEIAHRANVIPRDHRGHRTHAAALARNVLIIAVGQVILPQRSKTSQHRRSPPRPNEHDVLTQRIELLLVSRAKSLPQSDQQQQRKYSPGDPEHGQERPKLVSPQRPQGLPEDIKKKPHVCIIRTAL